MAIIRPPSPLAQANAAEPIHPSQTASSRTSVSDGRSGAISEPPSVATPGSIREGPTRSQYGMPVKRALTGFGSLMPTPAISGHVIPEEMADEAIRAVESLIPEYEEFHELKRQYSMSAGDLEQLQEDFKDMRIEFAASASAGLELASLNDHAGVLKMTIPERTADGAVQLLVCHRLTVIKGRVWSVDAAAAGRGKQRAGQEADATPAKELRYFVKGYADRIVPVKSLRSLLEQMRDGTPPQQRKDNKETVFQSELLQLSKDSQLWARRIENEAPDDALMPVMPNPSVYPGKIKWGNQEVNLAMGAGPKDDDNFYPVYVNFDPIEKKLVVFRVDKPIHNEEGGKRRTAFIDGSVLGMIEGVESMEPMRSSQAMPGVKGGKSSKALASMRKIAGAPANIDDTEQQAVAPRLERRLRIMTSDGAIHELAVGEFGVRLALVNPKPGAAGARIAFNQKQAGKPEEEGDGRLVVDVYSFRGHDRGPLGPPQGSRFITSNGDELSFATFIERPGNLRTAQRAAARLVLTEFPPVPGPAQILGLLLTAAIRGSMAYGGNTLLHLAQSQNESHTLLGGKQSFSGAGAGRVDSSDMFKALFLTVVLQQVVTGIFALLERIEPDYLKRADTWVGELGNRFALPAGEEFVRQQTNYFVQKTIVGLPRGGGLDIATQASLSLTAGLIAWAEKRSAAQPANHFGPAVAAELGRYLLRHVWRGTGNLLNSAGDGNNAAAQDWLESFLSRLISRPEQLTRVVAILLNHAGVVGENASAHTGALSWEMRYERGLLALQWLMQHVAAYGWQKGMDFQSVKTVNDSLRHLADVLYAAKRQLGRLGLKTDKSNDATLEAIHELTEMATLGPAERAARSADYNNALRKALDSQIEISREYIASLQQELVAASHAEAGEDGADAAIPETPAPGGPAAERRPHVYTRDQLPESFQRFMQRLEQTQGEDANYPTQVGLDQRRWPAGAMPGKLKDSRRIKIDASTWSRTAQGQQLRIHKAMEKMPGLETIDINAKGKLSSFVIDSGKAGFSVYSMESGGINYMLRWDVTGELQLLKISEGMNVPYRAMIGRGSDSGRAFTNPVKDASYSLPTRLLYMNLCYQYADKTPALVQRAVATEAAYVADGDQPPNGRAKVVRPGDLVGMTEVLSTAMARMEGSGFIATFGQAIGYGATPLQHSQRLFILQLTGVNAARDTEHSQAEIIMMPGALFKLEHIDSKSAEALRRKGNKVPAEIGQVSYLAQVDTYALEKRYRQYQDGNVDGLQHGDDMIHPKSGHFYRWDAGEKKPVANVEAVKSYFLGRSLDWDPDAEVARWRSPLTADNVTDTMKEGPHLAIMGRILAEVRDAMKEGSPIVVRNRIRTDKEPIVDHLDEAVENAHHKEFQRLGGFFETAWHQEEKAEREALRRDAQALRSRLPVTITDELKKFGAAGRFEFPGELLAWLAVNVLKQPVEFFDIHDMGNKHSLPKKTYNRVVLRDKRAVPVWVGDESFHFSQADANGGTHLLRMRAEGEDGFTAANLLHTIHYGLSDVPRHYYTEHEEGGRKFLVPGRQAQEDVRLLFKLLIAFSGVDFALLQEKMVGMAKELGWQPGENGAAATALASTAAIAVDNTV